MKTINVLLLCLVLVAGACSSSKTTTGNQADASETAESSQERDGSSYEKAIIAKSISAEYEWLRKNYPGSKFLQQSLREKNGKHYDVLSVQLPDGTKKDFYFDINSFFGKGF